MFAAIGLVILAVACSFLYFNDNKPNSRPTKQESHSTAQNLTAGGVVVPEKYVKKAKSLGYYCPSWAAKPGEIASDTCLTLDK